MTDRTFTIVVCACGHRGAIVESRHVSPPIDWYMISLQQLKHDGHYDGIDRLFADATPSCPVCGASLGPENRLNHV